MFAWSSSTLCCYQTSLLLVFVLWVQPNSIIPCSSYYMFWLQTKTLFFITYKINCVAGTKDSNNLYLVFQYTLLSSNIIIVFFYCEYNQIVLFHVHHITFFDSTPKISLFLTNNDQFCCWGQGLWVTFTWSPNTLCCYQTSSLLVFVLWVQLNSILPCSSHYLFQLHTQKFSFYNNKD